MINPVINNDTKLKARSFKNTGFALIYNDNLYDKKIITDKIDERSLIIFQKNLKINTQVKITNIRNNKSLIAKVGKKSDYPKFNNSVISLRIAEDLNIDDSEPYVEIISINNEKLFVANRAKTYEEEKKVAQKVPVNSISINDLNEINIKNDKKINKRFSYIIKIADFYFDSTAIIMIERIKAKTLIAKPKIKKMSSKQFRVYLGPFKNINTLQNSFNDINILEFENIEIIKND